jgi:endonuclease/exonuclease/phosphatase family metal-dependent hydrolase
MTANPRTHPPGWQLKARQAFLILLTAAATVTLDAQNIPAEPSLQGEGSLKVMTYNMYVGTEYAGVANPDYDVFLQAVTNMIQDARDSDPAGRAQAIARQIAATRPHVVSLQEVATWSTGVTKDDLTLEFDYLELLLDALHDLGESYVVVHSVTTWDITLPDSLGEYVRQTWGVALIARADLKSEDFSYVNSDGAPWVATLLVRLRALDNNPEVCPVPLRPSDGACRAPVPRGWVSADVTYRGRQSRIIGAHLDHFPQGILQVDELLNGPADITLPVVVAADLNCDLSDPDDLAYPACVKMLDAGFIDAWSAANPSEPGYTKTFSLTEPHPLLTMRGDYVMVRGRFGVQAVVLVGEEEATDKTESDLWPSDHCGVVARLQLPWDQ